jgi:hypothetical protein
MTGKLFMNIAFILYGSNLEELRWKINTQISTEVLKIDFQVYYTEILFVVLHLLSGANILLFES